MIFDPAKNTVEPANPAKNTEVAEAVRIPVTLSRMANTVFHSALLLPMSMCLCVKFGLLGFTFTLSRNVTQPAANLRP